MKDMLTHHFALSHIIKRDLQTVVRIYVSVT